MLENRPEEELTEAERKEAWEHWELEKQGILNAPQVTAEQIQRMYDVTGRGPAKVDWKKVRSEIKEDLKRLRCNFCRNLKCNSEEKGCIPIIKHSLNQSHNV